MMRFLPQFIAFGSVLPFLAGANLNVGGIELLKPLPERVEISRGLQHYSHGLYSKLHNRQALGVTTTPACNEFDNYLYITTTNYTWQLQCSTNYDGQSIDQVTANNFSACVGTCVEYNHATTTGICLGVTFNGPNDGAIGQCTLYSSISSESLADEEGNVQDSAMLVSSPDGTQYATPQPDPGFSGAPTQAPSIDPLSSETSGAPESTFTSTSIVYVTSCPPDVTDCPGTSLQTTDLESTSTATSSGLNATPIFTTTSSTVLNTSSSSSGSQSGVSSSIAMITTSTDLSSQQSTITSIVAFTEYRLQVVEICGNIPTSCMTSTSTSLLVSNKTELKCYPGPCAGIMTATDTMDVVETSFCIVGS